MVVYLYFYLFIYLFVGTQWTHVEPPMGGAPLQGIKAEVDGLMVEASEDLPVLRALLGGRRSRVSYVSLAAAGCTQLVDAWAMMGYLKDDPMDVSDRILSLDWSMVPKSIFSTTMCPERIDVQHNYCWLMIVNHL